MLSDSAGGSGDRHTGQYDIRDRAAARSAEEKNLAPGLTDEAGTARQAPAMMPGFGRKDRIERALCDLGRHTATGVFHAQADIVAGGQPPELSFLQLCLGGGNAQAALSVHRGGGVPRQLLQRARKLFLV